MLASPASSRTTAPVARDLVRALNAEWVQLRQQPDSDAAVRRWVELEPALAGAGRLADVERLAAGHADQVLAALLRLTHGGDALAGRVLLQLQLGAAVNLALRTVHHAGGDLEEAKACAVACLWEVIAAYPLPRRRGNHAAGLALDVLNRLTSHTDHRPGRALRRAALLELPQEDLLQSLAQCPEPDVDPDPTAEVLELLGWAVRRSVLTDVEAELLRRLHTSGPDRELTQAALARQLGVSHAALRQRTSRATRRLAGAVQRDRTAPTSSARQRAA